MRKIIDWVLAPERARLRWGIAFVVAACVFAYLASNGVFTPVSGTDSAAPGQNQSSSRTSQTGSSGGSTPASSGAARSDLAGPYLVTFVVDGDTIEVSIDNQLVRVRLIGVNAPESPGPYRTEQCFGTEAASYTKAALNGQYVYLEADTTQGDVDQYGRSLRFVYLADGSNFNLQLVAEGYASEYTYNRSQP